MNTSLIFDVTEHDFTRQVIETSRLTPVLDRLVSHSRGQILLAKIDADENMKLGRSRHPV